ncbi:MAG: GH32 C-terminal domain-containing protein [Methanoregula sp.]|uniref:GH32 C-terminal domain-containing protein n=1 Tax=Methanoregula sp. TaxID=2052170 RepID=UPI003FD73424
MKNWISIANALSVLFMALGAAWSQVPGGATQPAAAARPDVVLADFEGVDYGDWKTTGEAFGSGPRRGDNSVWPFQGERYASSMNKGDASVGTLASPQFKIDRRYITFLISGGNHPGETCINLLVDGKVARTATGADHEWMVRCLWDVAEFTGKSATVEIVDKHTGNWGHINIDGIVMTDEQRFSPWMFFDGQDAACVRLPLYVCVRQDPNDKHWPDDKTKVQLASNAQWRINGTLFGPEVGRMISPDFRIDRKYMNFYCSPWFGEMTALTLRVDGQVVAVSGYGPMSGDGWRCWDVSAYAGKTGRFEIIDRHSVNIPQIVRLAVFLGDEKLPCCQLVSQFKDPRQIEAALPGPCKYQPGSDVIVKEDLSSDYSEKYRPQFHFTVNHGWMNDPHCLYYDGEYHLFMEHLGWGHAVSKDLVHWVQLQNALSADNLGDCWSGSAVVDWNNTSGFQTGKEKPLVAVFTSYRNFNVNPTETLSRQVQSIAYSNDRGRTWTKHEGNPVIPEQDRDPKMFWYEPDKSWRLVLYQCPPGRAYFASKDLKHWTKVGSGSYGSECPDFFELPIAGEPKATKWVAVTGDGTYFIGDFDGKDFKTDGADLHVEYGPNFYATQTFNDIPKSDGRRIQITWMNGGSAYPETPTAGQQMTFPRELTLRRCPEGLRMFSNPVREIEKLHGKEHAWKDLTLAPGENPLGELKGDLFDVRIEIDPLDATEVGLRVRGEDICYNVKDAKLTCRKNEQEHKGEAPVELQNHRLKLQVLVDRVSLETFAQDGKATISAKFMPKDNAAPLDLYALGGKAKIVSLTVYELNSAWTQPPRKDRSRAQGGFIKLGPIGPPGVHIGKIIKEIGKVGAQNWQLADDTAVNWWKNDPQDNLCEPDQTALPKMPGKNYYILQTDISSDKEQDVLFDPGDYFKPVILFVFEGRGNLAIDKLHLSAGNNRLVLLCAAAGPATIRLLKPGTKDRADVEFLPPAIDDKAAPYVPPSAKPLTRKTLAGKWRARITLKLPPAPSIDQPHPDPGLTEQARKFVAADADDRDWEVVPVPSPNGQYSKEWCNINGESVFRKSVNIPAEWAGKDLTLSLGAIDDFDDTFFNGVFVGRTDKNTYRFFAAPRVYRVPGKLVKAGANVIAVRAFDHFGGGGMLGPEADLFIAPAQ